MSSKGQWKRFIAGLDDNFHPIAVDLYGYGKTAMPEHSEQFSLDDEIERICAVIDQHLPKGAPFHLMGHSYGGAIALRLAHEQADRVLSLALFEPAAFYLLEQADPGHREISAVVAGLRQKIATDKAGATCDFLDYWSGQGTFAAIAPNIQQVLIGQIDKVQLDFQALLGDPLRLADLRKLDLPVCLLSGNGTTLAAKRIASLLSQTLPRVYCQSFEGGHMLPITDAEPVNAAFMKFLEESELLMRSPDLAS